MTADGDDSVCVCIAAYNAEDTIARAVPYYEQEIAPALKEVAPLVADLADLGTTGLATLDMLALAATPLPEWRDAQLAILDRAARPKAALEFPMVPMMRELVFAAMSQAEARTMKPDEWRAHVKTLASPPRRGRGGAPQ